MTEPKPSYDPALLLSSTTAIVVAAVSTSAVQKSDIPDLIASTFKALVGTADLTPDIPEADPEPAFIPAVSVRKSLASDDHIISLIDGKPYKTLRRHLGTYGLTPDEYRRRYGLNADYPMVAKNYSESRSAMAKAIGLGRKPGTPA